LKRQQPGLNGQPPWFDRIGPTTDPSQLSISGTAWRWWRDTSARAGGFRATRDLILLLWEFARDSTPDRRRARFGDAEYDWEHRVNTTSGAVAWRERLLGMFHSPYQPTEPELFREMLAAVAGHPGFEFPDFTFIDLGSGKGRTLLMAADYPFRRIVGVELLPALHAIAAANVKEYKSESQKCSAIDVLCGDAAEYEFPLEPILLYLFNPLPEVGLRCMVANLEQSLQSRPRRVVVLYHNPQLEHVVAEGSLLGKAGGTHQYSIFVTNSMSS